MAENMQKKELVITRTFDAPLEKVWKAWSSAENMAKWWGPKEFEISVKKLEFRKNGVFHYMMKASHNQEIWGKFVYGEIVAPERFEFVNGFSNANEDFVRNPWMKIWPLQVQNTVTFEEKDGKTTVTLRAYPINATPEELAAFKGNNESMLQGLAGTWSQLDEYLKTL